MSICTRYAARALAVAAVLLGASACAGVSARLDTAVPKPMPTPALRNGACVTPRSLPKAGQPTHGLVTVDPHPHSVTAVWMPGLNQRPCRTATTRAGTSIATRLARDIRSAPRFPTGVFYCPMDDGSAVHLYFSYATGHSPEYVSVGLRGCATVGAPDRAARRATERLLRDLAVVAPAPWKDALTRWIS